jgi:hypothetical protein
MPTPKERLSHLLELAAQGPAERAALAGEVADLLIDWPPQYPAQMRATFEALLEKIVREVDHAACTGLAARFEGRGDFPLSLMNSFFLCASPALQDAILARNDAVGPLDGFAADGAQLLLAARTAKDFAAELMHIVGLNEKTARALVAEPGARGQESRGLAALAKGAGINRATFSAMAILAGPARSVHENFAMLAMYDAVPADGARRLVVFWRARAEPSTPLMREAAA